MTTTPCQSINVQNDLGVKGSPIQPPKGAVEAVHSFSNGIVGAVHSVLERCEVYSSIGAVGITQYLEGL